MDRIADRYRRRNRVWRWLTRVMSLAVISLLVTQLIPTLAEEATPPPSDINLAAVSESGTVLLVDPSGSDVGVAANNDPVTMGESATITYLNSESQSANVKVKVRVRTEISATTRIPDRFKVDPRAVTTLLPELGLSGEGTLLACFQGVGLRFDSGRKGFVDDEEGDDLLIDGDLTGSLRISGSAAAILSQINRDQGMRVWSSGGALPGKRMDLALISTTGLSVEAELCSQVTPRTLLFEALGISLDTKKGGVQLSK